MNNSVYLLFKVGMTVINNFIVCATSYLFLRPLAGHPLKSFLTSDAITSDNAL